MRFSILSSFLLFSILSFTQNALDFDGSDDGVNCGTASVLDVGGTAFSLEAWINASSWNTNAFQGTIAIKENNTNNGGFMFRAGASGVINFAIGAGTNSAWSELTTSSVLNTGTWYHVAATYDGSKMKIYLDGLLIDSLSSTITVGGSSSTPLTIGYHPTYTGRVWNGKIDEFRVWDKALTQSEITANMNSEFCSLTVTDLAGYYKMDAGTPQSTNTGVTSAIDYSGNQNNGTLSNFSLSGTSSNWVYGKVLTQDTVSTSDTLKKCGAYYDADLQMYITQPTTVTRHIPSHTGCDSSATKVFIINSTSNETHNVWACDSFTSPTGTVYNATGTYYSFFKNVQGCDSIITIHLVVGADSSFIDTSACLSYTSSNGNIYTQSGVYYEVFTSFRGCDSIVQITAEIYAKSYGNIGMETCDSVQNLLLTKWLKPGDTTSDTLVNESGCDSIVNISVSSLKSYNTIDTSECDSYTSASGKLWTSSGTYIDTIPNNAGCDSILTYNLTILMPTSEVLTINSCFEAILPTSNERVTVSGTYYDTLVSTAGCDSFITMNVSIKTVNTVVSAVDQTLTALSTNGSFQWLDCTDNYAKINTKTSRDFQYENSGEYAVEVTDNECIDTSECYSLTGLSISDFVRKPTFLVFPNPSRGYFNITSDEVITGARLVIYAVSGQKVYEDKIQNSKNYSCTYPLDTGIYIIELAVSDNLMRQMLQVR
jgi:hypothetical protein